MKSAVRIARRDDFEIANTFRPGRDACSAEADFGLVKVGSCAAHLCLEYGAIGPYGMEDDGHFASESNLGLFGADAFSQLAAPALERRTLPDNRQQNIRGLEQIGSSLVVAAL